MNCAADPTADPVSAAGPSPHKNSNSMMKRFFGVVAALFLSAASFAQTDLVAVTPYVCDELELPAGVKNTLQQRMLQLATQNGYGSLSGEFVLTPNVLVLDKKTTATAPAQFIVDLEISVYVVAVAEQTIIAETAVPVRGIGASESKAYISAINRLSPRTPAMRNFMNSCRERIVDYYAQRVPVLIAKAQSLADREQYVEAVAVLDAIPESVPEYASVASLKVELATQLLDRVAEMAMQRAKVEMVKGNYAEAMDALVAVNPASNKAKEAYAMIDQVAAKMSEAERAAREAELARLEQEREASQRAFDNQMMLEKMRLEASSKAAESARSAAAEVSLSGINAWLFGKLK